jgi:N-acetylneuraminate lyase
MPARLKGLIAAVCTPMHPDGRVNLSIVEPMVERLLADGVQGFYVCGSTGEGISLTSAERRDVAAAFVRATSRRVPVIVQVGHNALGEARELAAHAQQIGADAVSANAPSYFKVESAALLTACMAEIAAAAPELPFYYYHIPVLTGARVDLIEFLERASAIIPNLAGLKYTTPRLDEYQACLEWDKRRLDVLWGTDEMLLPALAVGAEGAVGSTYNLAGPLYRRMLRAFEAGCLEEARTFQWRSIQLIRVMGRYPFFAALKQMLAWRGLDCGPCRVPLANLTPALREQLREDLNSIEFFAEAEFGASGTDVSPVGS